MRGVRGRVGIGEGEELASDVKRVGDDVVLEELVQLVEAIPAHQVVDDEFVQERLRRDIVNGYILGGCQEVSKKREEGRDTQE